MYKLEEIGVVNYWYTGAGKLAAKISLCFITLRVH
jgi:hypothetical protein